MFALILPQKTLAEEVNVYSYRQPQLIKPMFDVFTADTGIKVNAVFAKTGMLERLKSEGANSPADLVFTVDIGRLTDIKNAGLTRAVDVAAINKNIPKEMRDVDKHWFGLTARARIIVASKTRVKQNEISRYEELADEKWRGRICSRSGKHAYNIALTAGMIEHYGIKRAEEWLAGVKKNLARTPQGNDRAQIKAIAQGVCDVALVNHYYIYVMMSDDNQRASAELVDVIFPNQNGRGVHVNVSGMAMTKHSPNVGNALRLMTFLASDRAQRMYAEVNGEYPVNADIPVGEFLRALGAFKRDAVNLSRVAGHRAVASRVVDRVGFND